MRIEISNTEQFSKMLFSKYKISCKNDIKGLSIDSRLVKYGDVFIPLAGQNFDGHQFIENAINLGASLIFSEKKLTINSKKIKYVDSTYNSLTNIAKEWRKKFNGNIIGITGSNGKTTTKELLASILSKNIKCNYTKGNFNSTTGVPLSIIGMETDSDAYIIELGMSKPGEIKSLCDISNPNIGLITNISEAHIKNFKSLNNIALEKSSLFLSLSNNDIAFYNIDDPFISDIPTKAKKISYSLNKKADYCGKMIINTNGTIHLSINNKINIHLPYSTKSFAYNALAAFSIADYLNINKNDIINSIEKFENLSGRGKIYNYGDYIVIDDTYNSNLESAKESISNLSHYNSKHRSIAVIGDMLELGDKAIPFHQKLGEYISTKQIDSVFGFGQLTKYTIETLKSKNINAYSFDDKEKLSFQLKKFIKPGDVILFKASRGMYLEKILKRVFK